MGFRRKAAQLPQFDSPRPAASERGAGMPTQLRTAEIDV